MSAFSEPIAHKALCQYLVLGDFHASIEEVGGLPNQHIYEMLPPTPSPKEVDDIVDSFELRVDVWVENARIDNYAVAFKIRQFEFCIGFRIH
jgi:hypothetical protein